jgi:hypothetical protein
MDFTLKDTILAVKGVIGGTLAFLSARKLKKSRNRPANKMSLFTPGLQMVTAGKSTCRKYFHLLYVKYAYVEGN